MGQLAEAGRPVDASDGHASVRGMHVPMCALSGTDRVFSAEEQAREWIEYTGLLAMPESATHMWNTFRDAAVDFAIFSAQGLGLDDRLVLERTSWIDVVSRLTASKAEIYETLPPLIRKMTGTLVALANQQPEALLDFQAGFFNQEPTWVAEVLLDTQYACYSVDLDAAHANVYVDSTMHEDGVQSKNWDSRAPENAAVALFRFAVIAALRDCRCPVLALEADDDAAEHRGDCHCSLECRTEHQKRSYAKLVQP